MCVLGCGVLNPVIFFVYARRLSFFTKSTATIGLDPRCVHKWMACFQSSLTRCYEPSKLHSCEQSHAPSSYYVGSCKSETSHFNCARAYAGSLRLFCGSCKGSFALVSHQRNSPVCLMRVAHENFLPTSGEKAYCDHAQRSTKG